MTADARVYVDGVRLPDGSPGEDPAAPFGLSGLEVGWGRSTVLDQPEASTCTLDVLDPSGGHAFAGMFHTGARVVVDSTVTQWDPPGVSTFDDPSLETGEVLWTQWIGRAPVWQTDRYLSPTHGVRCASSVYLHPSHRSTVPGAWDHIPKAGAGQTWSYKLDVWIALEGAPTWINVAPCYTRDTMAFPYLQRVFFPTELEPGWNHLEGSFVIEDDADGAWMGLVLDRPVTTLPRWSTIDPAATWSSLDPTVTYADVGTFVVDDVDILSPGGSTTRDVRVFEGRVTDLKVAYEDDLGGPVLEVACIDLTADLDNIEIGDEPWPLEVMADRFQRVLDLAGGGVTAAIDQGPGSQWLSWQDVDQQAAGSLLRDFSASTDAILWPAVHPTTGPFLRVVDATARASMDELNQGEDGVVRIEPTGGHPLSACDVLRDPVAWVQDVADISTRVAVAWLEQTLDDEGNEAPTERTETIINAELEARLGVRRISLSTLLADQTAALRVADSLAARTSVGGWRAEGIVVEINDVDDAEGDLVAALLDGVARNGLPLRITDLPDWAPVGDVPVYVEGGTYTYADGAWTLNLTLSEAAGQGKSARWGELEVGWRWSDFDATIRWSDLRGVGVRPEAQRPESEA